jgi:CheY-like chemotaxis protein
VTEKLVLIADDDSEMRRVLETAMAVQQVRTMTASDHEQMLALARIEHPQLIIAGDVGKRRSDGFAVIKQLKTDPTTAAIPVLAVTGLCSPELHRAQTAGVRRAAHQARNRDHLGRRREPIDRARRAPAD